MNRRSNKAFTLLEIIIVIIIIGVLASLALPRLFAMVEATYGVEAVSAIGTIRAAVERCYLMHGSYSSCTNFGNNSTLDIDNPSQAAGSHFDYMFVTAAFEDFSYCIAAFRKPAGLWPYGPIVLTYNKRCTPPLSAEADPVYIGSNGDNKFTWGASPMYKGIIPK